jgi:CBS domain containing-hemolysin-like protein
MVVLFLIVLGFVLAAFFSGSETALVSINWIRLEHWLEKGRIGAAALERFVSEPSRFLGTTLVGTNIAIVMTSSLASWVLARALSGWAPGLVGVVSTVVVTITLLVFGEIIPKVVGRRHSDVITLKVIHPLRVFYWVFSPIIWVVTGAASGLLRVAGIRTKRWRRRLTKDQLRLLLTSEGERAGAVDEEETKLISGIFEFALTTVEEVMVPRTDIVGLDPGATVGDAVDLIRAHGFSRLPVFTEDHDRIEGMVHSRDVLGLPRDRSIDGLLRPLPRVPESKMCDALFRELQARRQHMAVVVDEHGSLAGVVTLEDLLEELVGEIEDEYDVREALVRVIDDGLFMIDGRAEIDTVEDALRIDLPEGDYNTIAGLVLRALGRIPEAGDEVVVGRLEIRVISAGPTRIGKLRVRKR